jgi:hypothetical protein
MKILTAIICCDFKSYSLSECIESVRKAGFEDILLNYEGIVLDSYPVTYTQEWLVTGSGFDESRKFDQDQDYRLSRITIARNMCLEFAQLKGYDWILFVDSDVLIPIDTKAILFEEQPYKIRSGIVPGRGIHSEAKYMFYPHEIEGYWQRADYFTCGFMAIHKSVFSKLRFRWGQPIYGEQIASEDPLFGSDARAILKEFWWGNLKLKAEHIGELKHGETSQF